MAPRSVSLGRSKLSVQAREVFRHPVEMLYRVRGRVELAREKGGVAYSATDDWESNLHEALGATWPCPLTARFGEIWTSIASTIEDIGRGHDADPAFARALWCIANHTEPDRVVELGVGRGISTRLLLEAMGTDTAGRLWSIDLPPLLEGWRTSVAAAVPQPLRGHWTYVRGPGRRKLSPLLRSLGDIGLLVHDALHTAPTVERELGLAWPHVRPGGWLVIDGIQRSDAFRVFVEAHQPKRVIIGVHEQKQGFLGLIRRN